MTLFAHGSPADLNGKSQTILMQYYKPRFSLVLNPYKRKDTVHCYLSHIIERFIDSINIIFQL